MDKFTLYLQKFDILQNVTDDEVKKSETLLRTYGPMLHSAAQGIDELEEECYAGRRQSISDFINLAIDYDRCRPPAHCRAPGRYGALHAATLHFGNRVAACEG